jgi:hypothetical protein
MICAPAIDGFNVKRYKGHQLKVSLLQELNSELVISFVLDLVHVVMTEA